ncbi:integrase [Burkholderia vietnamiensis]|uniref:integrase n=1 Tax=Burkholderia vietnamiensis TaxID=60552 RepID=UPI001593C5DA|nr:integrase [Burkholderia vietnamiensis]
MQQARRILLPQFTVTEVAQADDEGAIRIPLPETARDPAYYIRHKRIEGEHARVDGKPAWKGVQFNLFPVVLDGSGIPWAEACTFLLFRLENDIAPNMVTYGSLADDLAAYRRFLEEAGIDWLHFPAHKQSRPTYRYNGHLRLAVAAGEIADTTAKRRMGAVVRFYRWLAQEKVFEPAHPAWKESDRFVDFKDAAGFSMVKQVTTTDLAIAVTTEVDPYAGYIDDGGKLRPLPEDEQRWLVEALVAHGNTEMTLIHLLGLLTGARIQTILTVRVGHVRPEVSRSESGEVRLPVGPGTGIDTKNNKRLVLHIPHWFYEMLRTYAFSDRARRRRLRASGGDVDGQYLFLSARGAPFYRSKEDASIFDDTNRVRHQKVGQSVRQFITEHVIPYVRAHHRPSFSYRFHDTRASYGMNLTDHQLALVARGETTLSAAREFVRVRMGHQSSATTDRYLDYRNNMALVRSASDGYESHLRSLSEMAMSGLMQG